MCEWDTPLHMQQTQYVNIILLNSKVTLSLKPCKLIMPWDSLWQWRKPTCHLPQCLCQYINRLKDNEYACSELLWTTFVCATQISLKLIMIFGNWPMIAIKLNHFLTSALFTKTICGQAGTDTVYEKNEQYQHWRCEAKAIWTQLLQIVQICTIASEITTNMIVPINIRI